MEKVAPVPKFDPKIVDFIREINVLHAFLQDEKTSQDKTAAYHAKVKEFADYVVTNGSLIELDQGEGSISLQECAKYQRFFHELRMAAIKQNNSKYAVFLFNRQNPIDVFMAQEAIKSHRGDLLLQIIRGQIAHQILDARGLENIIAMMLNNKRHDLAAVLMQEFANMLSIPSLITKYILIGDMALLDKFMDQHKQDTFEMGQSICHLVQHEASKTNFMITNTLLKRGINVWNYKIAYLKKVQAEEKNILKKMNVDFDIIHTKQEQCRFWRRLTDEGCIDPLIEMIERDKPNDKEFIDELLMSTAMHLRIESIRTVGLLFRKDGDNPLAEKYKRFFSAILGYPQHRSNELLCANLMLVNQGKDMLWPLLERYKDEKNVSQLTFIEEVQILALKASQFNTALDIATKYSVDAPAKKIKLLSSQVSLSNKDRKELAEIMKLQELESQNKPSVFSTVMQRFFAFRPPASSLAEDTMHRHMRIG